jgi:hypothetical protein
MSTTTEAPPVRDPGRHRGEVSRWWHPGDGRRLLTTIAACVGLAALLTWLLPLLGRPLYTGPLDRDGSQQVGSEHASFAYDSALRQHVGDRFTYGLTVLELPRGSTDIAVIRTVEPVGLSAGLRYLGAMLGSPARTQTQDEVRQWPPPPGRLHAAVPLSTPIDSNGNGWELYLGFAVTAPGHYVVRGWWITYTVGARSYRYWEPGQIDVCTPQFLTARGGCPATPLSFSPG